MSTDFFDDLERQLVAATPHRGARIRRARVRRAAAAASAIVVLLAGGAGIAAAVGSGDGTGPGPDRAPAGATTATATTPTTTTTLPATPEPFSYEVAILNGTTIPGLGRAVATRLMGQQIRAGVYGNASRQDATETRVYYRSKDCLPAANQVAAALRLGDARGRFTLRPITAAQTALVGQGPVVLVVVGSDQNRPAGP
jgi:hypothetical protein